MRVIMGVLRSKHGAYYVRKKVPPNLEAATSTVTGASRPRVSWLKKSLHTKDALTGHSGGGVGRSYGAKGMMQRFGLPRLAEAVAKAEYPGSASNLLQLAPGKDSLRVKREFAAWDDDYLAALVTRR